MKSISFLGFSFLTGLLLSFNACRQESLPDLQPSKAIEGQYKASYINLTGSTKVGYPINGQTLNIQIRPVTADVVHVDIQAPPNGKYSPGQNLSYPDAQVTKVQQSNGTFIYYISIADSVSTCGPTILSVYPTAEIDYYFVAPGNQPCVSSRVRFVKQ